MRSPASCLVANLFINNIYRCTFGVFLRIIKLEIYLKTRWYFRGITHHLFLGKLNNEQWTLLPQANFVNTDMMRIFLHINTCCFLYFLNSPNLTIYICLFSLSIQSLYNAELLCIKELWWDYNVWAEIYVNSSWLVLR